MAREPKSITLPVAGGVTLLGLVNFGLSVLSAPSDAKTWYNILKDPLPVWVLPLASGVFVALALADRARFRRELRLAPLVGARALIDRDLKTEVARLRFENKVAVTQNERLSAELAKEAIDREARTELMRSASRANMLREQEIETAIRDWQEKEREYQETINNRDRALFEVNALLRYGTPWPSFPAIEPDELRGVRSELAKLRLALDPLAEAFDGISRVMHNALLEVDGSERRPEYWIVFCLKRVRAHAAGSFHGFRDSVSTTSGDPRAPFLVLDRCYNDYTKWIARIAGWVPVTTTPEYRQFFEANAAFRAACDATLLVPELKAIKEALAWSRSDHGGVITLPMPRSPDTEAPPPSESDA